MSVQNTPLMALANSAKSRIVARLAGWCYARAHGTVTVPEGVADVLADGENLSREAIRVIYNPIVSQEVFELAEEPVTHPRFSADECPAILSAGRLTGRRDYPELRRPFSKPAKRRPARLILLGEGEDCARLEAMVLDLGLADLVSLPRFVQGLYALFSKAVVLVLSLAREGFGDELVEMMASGVALVSTDCPSGTAAILGNGRLGRLAPVGAADAPATALADVLVDPCPPDYSLGALEYNIGQAVSGHLTAVGTGL